MNQHEFFLFAQRPAPTDITSPSTLPIPQPLPSASSFFAFWTPSPNIPTTIRNLQFLPSFPSQPLIFSKKLGPRRFETKSWSSDWEGREASDHSEEEREEQWERDDECKKEQWIKFNQPLLYLFHNEIVFWRGSGENSKTSWEGLCELGKESFNFLQPDESDKSKSRQEVHEQTYTS